MDTSQNSLKELCLTIDFNHLMISLFMGVLVDHDPGMVKGIIESAKEITKANDSIGEAYQNDLLKRLDLFEKAMFEMEKESMVK